MKPTQAQRVLHRKGCFQKLNSEHFSVCYMLKIGISEQRKTLINYRHIRLRQHAIHYVPRFAVLTRPLTSDGRETLRDYIILEPHDSALAFSQQCRLFVLCLLSIVCCSSQTLPSKCFASSIVPPWLSCSNWVVGSATRSIAFVRNIPFVV